MPQQYSVTDLFVEFGEPGKSGREVLLRHIQRKTGNEADALEIEGDLWLRASKSGCTFPTRAQGKAWLYIVANNLVVDLVRSRDFLVQAKPAPISNSAHDEDESGVMEVPYGDAEFTPESILLANEDLENGIVDLAQIKVENLRVLLLYLTGKTLAQIAEETNTPLSSVKARYYRGRAELEEIRQARKMRKGLTVVAAQG